MKNMRKKIIGIIFLLGCLYAFFIVQNNWLQVTYISVRSPQLPNEFNGYRIIHLSDLHNKQFGKGQRYLLKKIEKSAPDLVVYTGDLIDSNREGDEHSLTLMSELTKITPVYFVTGNHEWGSENFGRLEKQLQEIGVQLLRNEHAVIERNGDEIYIVGIDDPLFLPLNEVENTKQNLSSALRYTPNEAFTILLAHRPEKIAYYAAENMDLVFSGHAHGGQFRIPFIGGIVAPNQGFLPQYTAGKHIEKETTLIVHRGLGNSIIPIRIFNRPEIVIVELIK